VIPVSDLVEWKCPKCGATPDAHGKGDCGRDHPDRGLAYRHCMGFLCECAGDSKPPHGESPADPCYEARCYHCGWAGTFPPPPRALKPWEKKALAAGWIPPEGWAA